MKRMIGASAAALALVFALVGCAGSSTGSDGGAASSPSEESTSEAAAPATDAELAVADSSLGEIVVDGEGMTVYMFDKDTQGATSSACSGPCATAWPAVPASSTEMSVDGVTGEVGTITGVDGKPQLTLNGWPLYYYAADAAAGDVTGQGVNEVWWVLTPAGERMAG